MAHYLRQAGAGAGERERVWHTSVALFVRALGLGACIFVSASLPLTLVALSMALIGCYALKGPFWALATGWLAAGAAAGLAQINALGMLPMIGMTVVGGFAVLANRWNAAARAAHPVEQGIWWARQGLNL